METLNQLHAKKAFEAAVHNYKKGEQKEPHYHKLGTEINLLLEGKFILRNFDGKGTDQELNKGDVIKLGEKKYLLLQEYHLLGVSKNE